MKDPRAPLESHIESLVLRYHREQQGHAPSEIRVQIAEDLVIVRTSGIFTPTEQALAQTEEGRKLVQSARRELRALTRRDIEAAVSRTVGSEVLRSFYDLDVRQADQIEVYVLTQSAF